MSIFFDFVNFDETNIQLKTPQKKQLNNQQFTFIQLKYKKHEIFVKTPKIEAPSGLNTYISNEKHNYYLTLSLNERDIDPSIEKFYNFLKKAETFCQTYIKKSYQGSETLCFKSCIRKSNDNISFRLKILQNITEIYDEKSILHNIDQLDKLFKPHCHIISLIELNNIWISKTEYGLTWRAIQLKIYPPTRPMGGVSLLDEQIHIIETPQILAIPPPPPPPPYTLCQPKKPVHMGVCLSLISSGDFTLKKTDVSHKHIFSKSLQPLVSLNEIINIRQRLKKNNLS